MQGAVYDFDEQLAKGVSGEELLDAFFSREWIIRTATRREQRQGIDRHYVCRKDGRYFKVEYKTDYLAHKTGNAFIETVSIDSEGRAGWAYTSKADFLFYFVVEDLLLYILPMETIRKQLSRWAKEYPIKAVPNRGYRTYGILVPLCEFEEHSAQVVSI